ncbi:hypothetical protein CR513_26663, partial [Mucuna pruriens]
MGSEPEGNQIQNPTQQPHTQHHNHIASPQITTSRCAGHDAHSDSQVTLVPPHSFLPVPIPPQTFKPNENDVAPPSFSVGSFLRQRSTDFSAAIVKRVSSLRQSMDDEDEDEENREVTEFNLSGLKVVVTLKPEEEPSMKGRVSFFSRSNCRDCTAVRRFFREKGLRFVEINVDVFGERFGAADFLQREADWRARGAELAPEQR